MKYYMTVQSLW